MINTKLIFVDGISGSGKSTTAHYLYRQLVKNGIKTKWYFETDQSSPFRVRIDTGGKDIPENEWLDKFYECYPRQIAEFAEKAIKDDVVYIIECFLFQNILLFLIMYESDRDRIVRFYRQYMEIMKKLNPAVIHFFQKDVKKAVRLNFERRGDEWKNFIISRDEKGLFFKNRNLSGEEGFVKFFEEMSDIALRLYDGLYFAKIKIENSGQDWNEYRKKITDFLKIKQYEEELYDKDFKDFYGEYLGHGYLFKFSEKNKRHFLDTFLNGNLLHVSKNEYAIESYPFTLKFYKYGGVRKFRFTKDFSHIQAGSKAAEYRPSIMTEKELRQLCGSYRCEAEKLDRDIIMKDGILYYHISGKNEESPLMPEGKNRFIRLTKIENTVTFQKVKGTWQFRVWVKGHKPDAVFVKNENNVIEEEK
jgi:thymidylate kinase